MSAEAPPA